MSLQVTGSEPGAGDSPPDGVRWGSLVIKGAAWVAASRFLGQFVQLLAGVVLARALTPRDFGLVATVFIFMGVAGLVNDAGVATALVHKPTLEPEDLSSTFWVNLLMGLLMAGALAVFAPILAALYHQPPLRDLTFVVASAFALNVSVVPAALLERSLRFGALAMCDLVSTVAGVVGSVCALALGAGAFSLVVPPAISAVVRSAMALRAARWWPRFTVRRASLAYLWSFSSFFTLASVIFHVQNNFGAFIVGWRVGPWQLGLFSRGQTLSGVPAEQIPAVAAAAAVPALSALRRRGRDLTQPYVRAHAASVTGAGLLLGYLALTADFLVPRVYGAQWTGSVEILRYLCLAGLCAVVTGPSLWICYIIQRTDLLFRWQAVAALATISAAIVGSHWQALGVAKALAAVGLALIVPTFLYASRIGQIPLRATLRALAPGSLLAAAATVSALGVRVLLDRVGGASALITFVGESLAFAVVVAAAAWALDRRGIPLPGLDLVLRRIGLQAALDRRRPVPPPAVRDVERAGTRL